MVKRVRPAGPADLAGLMELAALSGRGFTSLPEDEQTLSARLALSAASFAGAVAPREAWYTLMLEDGTTGRLEGVAGVRAAVGLKRPHFAFRIMTLTQSSPTIDTHFDHRALILVNEASGWTEVGSLFVRAENRQGGAGGLLARARYMLIGAEPDRFSPTVIAELRGWFDDDETSPFWEGVTAKFFRIPFAAADHMVTSTNGQFILDLAPRHPIYVELIDEKACASIGRSHREGAAAAAMLEREGFQASGLIDIFDGGPKLCCARDAIATVRGGRNLRVRRGGDVEGPEQLISTRSVAAFRAVRARAVIEAETLVIEADALSALELGEGDPVRVRPS